MNNTPPLNIYKKIAGFFILITVILVLIILYYSISYAYIKIKPAVNEKSANFSVLVTENENSYDVDKGILKGILVDQTLEAEGEFKTTGKKTVVKDSKAKVVIINNSSKDQPLVKTTRLLTSDNVLFRIDDTIKVPAGGRTEITIYQDDPEIAASINIGDKFTIPGLNANSQKVIYAELIVSPTGDETEVSVLSQEDLDNAINSLIDKLKEQLASSLDQNEISVLQADILEETATPSISSITDTFSLKIKVNLKGVIINNDDVNQFAKKIFENNLSDDQILDNSSEGSSNLEVESIDKESNVVQLNGDMKAGVQLRKNASILQKDKLYKLSSDEAVAYLTNSDLIESASVSFFPFWVKKIPSFADHIIIEFEK